VGREKWIEVNERGAVEGLLVNAGVLELGRGTERGPVGVEEFAQTVLNRARTGAVLI